MRLKVGFAIVMLALFAGVLCAAEVPVQRDKPFVVVIDAGHGGRSEERCLLPSGCGSRSGAVCGVAM